MLRCCCMNIFDLVNSCVVQNSTFKLTRTLKKMCRCNGAFFECFSIKTPSGLRTIFLNFPVLHKCFKVIILSLSAWFSGSSVRILFLFYMFRLPFQICHEQKLSRSYKVAPLVNFSKSIRHIFTFFVAKLKMNEIRVAFILGSLVIVRCTVVCLEDYY